VDDHVRHILGAWTQLEHRNNLCEGIDSQPEPEHLCVAAQPGAQFVQLEMWKLEIAERTLVQGLSMLASASQPGSDCCLPVAEDTL
jgi:hypothetical protein